MANYLTTDTDLTSVANAIRTKGGTSAALAFPAGFVSAVEAIETGGGGGDGYKEKWLGLIARNQTAIEDADVTSIGKGVFKDYTTLTSAIFPNCTTVGDGAFNGCTNLATLKLPNLTRIAAGNAFNGIIASLVFPKLSSYPSVNAINGSKSAAIDLGPTIDSINAYMFQSSSNLTTLILRKTSLAALANINAFNNTPFASGKTGGTLYVPASLVSQYTQATNWSTILGYANNSIQAIEGSQYESYYADGTPIT